jgi:hypothetical protein
MFSYIVWFSSLFPVFCGSRLGFPFFFLDGQPLGCVILSLGAGIDGGASFSSGI